MSDFLRKASLKMKGSHSDLAASANGKPSTKPTRPPNSRSASAASSIHSIGEEDSGKGSRKNSLAKKSKKRLASLFSSSSLDTLTGDSDKHKHSHSHAHAHTGGSSHSTLAPPTRPSPLKTNSYTRLGTKRVPSSDAVPLAKDLDHLVLDHTTASPAPSSPVIPPTGLERGALRRTESLFSQWDLDGDSSDDDEVYHTPSEGLSEIGEGDGDEERAAGAAGTSSAAKTAAQAVPVDVEGKKADLAHRTETNQPAPGTAVDASHAHTHVPSSSSTAGSTKDTQIEIGDVYGTGPSTLHRQKATVGDTSVKAKALSKADVFSIDQSAVLGGDVDTTRELLVLFLRSRMREAEDMCLERDPDGVHLYLQVAYCIFQALKGLMTFDANDLANALEISKNVQIMATNLRKPNDGLMARWVKAGAGIQRLKGMSVMERHAELVFAESALFKALLAIVAGGDWFGMIREALNMRAAWGIYRTMQQFIEEADSHGYDDDIDMDFRSGVALGAGASSLMLSLLPGKVLKIAEVFGYGGDRDAALKILYSAGGWSQESDTPIHDEMNEGLRRPVVDLILLTFHLVISLLMPVAGVDIPMARKILQYNMRIYPDGIFFLYFQARLRTAECDPAAANKSLQRAMDLKLEYVQLQHMCLWDYANNYTMLGNWKGALDCFAILKQESNWSRAVYTYSAAACLVELVADGHDASIMAEAEKLMHEVPKLTKKMAGKSLPIEKLVSRKTRKFESQGQKLFLPGLELAYVFGSLGHAPRRSLIDTLIPRIDKRLAELEASTPEKYGKGYWDDFCLGRFLRGVCKFIARYQPPEANPAAREMREGDPSEEELDRGAEEDLLATIKHSPDIELDHYISYHCHFELGKLYARRGNKVDAQKHFEVVMSGKLAELNRHEQKAQGKYSLEGALLMKTHSAQQALKQGNVTA